jgi:Protein of unknown function (DUF1260).
MFGNSWKKKYTYLSKEYKKLISGNRQVLAQLGKLGDNQMLERELLHYIYFNKETDCAAYDAEVQSSGYLVKPAQVGLGVIVSSNNKTDIATVNDVVLLLANLAAAHNGEYDGWETTIRK